MEEILLIIGVVAFAFSIGAHYTGACMGMPFGSGSIRLVPALIVMAILALLGAVVASHRVDTTVGLSIVQSASVTLSGALVVIVSAFLLTSVYTARKIPTSTIQILVFCVVGMALGAGIPIDWGTIGKLAIIWVMAPPIALVLGYLGTHLLDRLVGFDPNAHQRSQRVLRTLGVILVIIGAGASFTMGANDVSNATGVLIMTHVTGVWVAGLIGGVGLALGVLTWGKPLLKKVAFDIVRVDLSMASAAQFVQAFVVLLAVSFGFFTSMNQALVGAMMGAGLARGTGTIDGKAIANIVKGWLIAPVSGIVIAFCLSKLLGVWVSL